MLVFGEIGSSLAFVTDGDVHACTSTHTLFHAAIARSMSTAKDSLPALPAKDITKASAKLGALENALEQGREGKVGGASTSYVLQKNGSYASRNGYRKVLPRKVVSKI